MLKKLLSALTILFCSIISFAQVNFEKGYYVDNNNNRFEVLIKNSDKRTNPSRVLYKKNIDSAIEDLSMQHVQEFGIYETSKFIRSTVNIDQSSQVINTLDTNRAPNYENRTVFLKSLIDGEFSLYSYINDNKELFFYNTPNSTTEQLVYKRYFVDRNKLRENNEFRSQLLEKLTCDKFSFTTMQEVNYTKKELTKFFKQANSCGASEFSDFTVAKENINFNLSLRPRINFSSTEAPGAPFESVNLAMDQEQGFGFGVEMEVVLPFNKNKWSVIAELAYQSFNAENTFENNNISGGFVNSKINYSSIEVPLGFRYYMYLGENSKLFINTAYVFDFTLNSEYEFTRADDTILRSGEFGTLGSLAGGIGYTYLNKISLEVRLTTVSNRPILFANSEFNSFSIILGYTLF